MLTCSPRPGNEGLEATLTLRGQMFPQHSDGAVLIVCVALYLWLRGGWNQF